MKGLLLDQICYEIVMSLGASQNMRSMLKKGLTTYMRRLNCRAGLVLKAVWDDGRLWFGPVYGVPRLMSRNKALSEILARLPEGATALEASPFFASLPLSGTVNGASYHVMPLPGFGLLVLVKSGEPFGCKVLNSLTRVNAKLATSCISCLNAEQAESTTQALERKVEEHKLAEDRFRRIFEGAVEGIFQTTWDGRPLRVNPALASILRHESPDELIAAIKDLGPDLYVRPHDREEMRRRLMSDGEIKGFETLFWRKDGTTVWITLSARLVCDEQGKAQFIEGMIEDVSQRKEAEFELQRAKDEAEKISQMKSNFLSMVSHELRTPLTSILGFSKILLRQMGECEERALQDEQALRHIARMRGNLQIISSESDRLTDLINNVLDLSRLESGRFEWHDAQVDMNEVLGHSLEVAQVLFRDKDVALETEIAVNLPGVVADRDRLVQVCVNLLSNAAKFTEQGSVTCRAWCESDTLLVEVQDTGMGISEFDTEVIFDKFRQLGDTLTDKPRGSGLGLPICKEIVEHYQGRLGVRQAPGGGSIFWFTLPVS